MSKLANLKKLTSRHKKMITALVLDGRKQSEIAKEFGISQTRLPQLKRDPLWAAEESALVERYRSECISKIQLLVPDLVDQELVAPSNIFVLTDFLSAGRH